MNLTGKYVISPIDGKKYCRKNGQFLRHLKNNGYKNYQDFFDQVFPEQITLCYCGSKNSFHNHKMQYLSHCGDSVCRGKRISDTKKAFTQEKWNSQRESYRKTMTAKTPEELQRLRAQRSQTGHTNRSYIDSVSKREQTCKSRHNNAKYNNSKQISQTKLNWSESRKQLFLDRLKESLNGKWLNDFHTEEMYIARRKMLEERGDIVPLDQLTKWELYNKKVRNLTEQNYRKHKKTINPNSLLRIRSSKGNLGHVGYQLDHIVPVLYGFQNNIPEELIASIENLQMLPWRENNSKGSKYDPSISTKHEELEN